MDLNRRSFLTRLAGGLVGACVLAKVPLEWVPTGVKKYAATEYLTKAWLAHTKGTGVRYYPVNMLAGSDLFDAFESEVQVCQRFVNEDTQRAGWHNLAFKSAILRRSPKRGWWVECEGANEA